jgi:hypothetical protein
VLKFDREVSFVDFDPAIGDAGAAAESKDAGGTRGPFMPA